MYIGFNIWNERTAWVGCFESFLRWTEVSVQNVTGELETVLKVDNWPPQRWLDGAGMDGSRLRDAAHYCITGTSNGLLIVDPHQQQKSRELAAISTLCLRYFCNEKTLLHGTRHESAMWSHLSNGVTSHVVRVFKVLGGSVVFKFIKRSIYI